jgi:hypothetical protein
VHETAVPPVSADTVVWPQPLAVTPPGGALHETVTFDVCQAKQLDGPGEQLGSGGDGGGAVAADCVSVRTASAETIATIIARRALTRSSSNP